LTKYIVSIEIFSARFLAAANMDKINYLKNEVPMQTIYPSSSRKTLSIALPVAILLTALAATPCRAGYTDFTSSGNPVLDYFANWFPRVTQIQSEQPHWITPLVTVTPRLEEELRYDQSWERLNSGDAHAQVDNFGNNKGVELIPFDPVEIIIGIPGYEFRNNPSEYGWADETFLAKYRILSANEQNGNYILTAFFGLSVPSGSEAFTSKHFGFTPTIAGGKGWGDFDVQTTVGVSFPDNGAVHTDLGTPIAWNTAFQYRVFKKFWPELEANYTYWPNGKHDHLSQLLLTPGVVVGRIPIAGRVGMTVGFGCEFAVTAGATQNRTLVLSGRIPF
jgi:hypothetical protein